LTVLALATLGDATKNRNNPIFWRVAQELLLVAVAGVIALDFANVNTALLMTKCRCVGQVLFGQMVIDRKVSSFI
jgi:hypothetical protein